MVEQERVLLVHAHPDDESIATGGTIATLIDRGAQVTVLTCTRGECGEVIPADLQHLLASQDALATHREGELADAMSVLGVTDQRFLGEANARWQGRSPRRYLDSGMVWGAIGAERVQHLDPDSLVAADFGEVASDIAAVVTDIHPHVIISYNEYGGYGHPDHIRAAQAARRAAEVYGIPFFAIEPAGSADEPTMQVDVSAVLDRKKAALSAHRTQVVVTGENFALSNNVSQPVGGVENFRRVHRGYEPGEAPLAAQTRAVRGISIGVGLVAGALVGAMLTVVHQTTTLIGDVSVPTGLVAAVLIVATLLTGLRLVFDSRLIAGSAGIGILLVIGLLSLQSSGGSVLVPPTVAGYVWTIAPTLITVVVLGWPQVRGRRRGKIIAPSIVKGSLQQ
ncbi:MAG: mycothiol biosynthesis protein [Glaciihabitans sp.]|nr:mycothiol biosynthesis protein [Glaciihabitans sp.]